MCKTFLKLVGKDERNPLPSGHRLLREDNSNAVNDEQNVVMEGLLKEADSSEIPIRTMQRELANVHEKYVLQFSKS